MSQPDLAPHSVPRKPPLTLMARRLAPHVAAGLIDFTEALDTLMEVAIERGHCTDWDRCGALQRWLNDMLSREAAR